MPSRSEFTATKTTTSTITAPESGKTTAPRHDARAFRGPQPPTHEQIALRAHELFVQSGYQGEREVEFWLQAERELKEALER